jgi:adenylate kinase
VIGLIGERTQRPDCQKGFILDGFPRTIPQAEALDQMLSQQGRKVDRVILFRIQDQELVSRLSGRRTCLNCGAMFHVVSAPSKQNSVCDSCGKGLVQRDDDQPAVIQKRLKVYHEQTEPLAGYYRQSGKLQSIDALESPQQVHDALALALK